MNPILLSSFHDELEKIASVGSLAAAIGGALAGGKGGEYIARAVGGGMGPITLATSLGGSMAAGSLYNELMRREIAKARKRERELGMRKRAFTQRPLFTMTQPELVRERTRLTRDFYKTDRKTPAVAGVAGGALSAAMSKAVVGKGMIPAAVVGGILSAHAASSIRKKRILRRLKAVSTRLRSVSAPVTLARRKG